MILIPFSFPLVSYLHTSGLSLSVKVVLVKYLVLTLWEAFVGNTSRREASLTDSGKQWGSAQKANF